MSALLEMIRQRKAELEALADQQRDAGLIDVTDADRIKALAALLARGSDDNDRLAALDALVSRHRARVPALDGLPASEPPPAASVAPPPAARTSEPFAGPIEPLPLGRLPDASAFVPPPRPPVVEPAGAPMIEAPRVHEAARAMPEQRRTRISDVWPRIERMPSPIRVILESRGEEAVMSLMHEHERPKDFRRRMEAGAAAAAAAEWQYERAKPGLWRCR